MNASDSNQNLHKATVQKIWQWLSARDPLISFHDYKDAHLKYISKVEEAGSNPHFKSLEIAPDVAKDIPANTGEYEKVSYSYRGLANIKSMVEKGIPAAFLTWHHGSFHHVAYSVARILPQVAIFTFPTYRYGEIFSYSMEKDKALSLFKMEHFLNKGRPLLYHIDGLPLGECITLNIFGVEARISSAPVRIIRAVEGVRIIPVTSYYEQKGEWDTINTIFHDPLPGQDILKQMTDTEVLSSLIAHFENDLFENAPEQISMAVFVKRELAAREVSLKREGERKSMA